VANYNVDIQVGIKGTGALDRFTKTVNALAEKTELVNKNFSKGIQNIARYEQNLNRTARTLKLARTGQQQETIAIKNFVKALGEANTARERQERLIKKEIATQNAAKRVTSPGPTGFSSAQFGPALSPARVKNIELGGQARLKGEQKLLRAKIKNTLEAQKQLKISQDIARLANQRQQGLSQFQSGIFPKPDLNREIQKRARLRSIARSTARIREQGLSKTNFQTKFELQLASQLVGIEKQITAEQQKQISAQQSLAKQRERALESARRAGGPSSPIRGSANMPGSPKALAAQRGGGGGKGKGLSNLALGVGFPLLFGGGVGSVAGGALGSVGGMGGQVLGSALGGIFDTFAQGVAELGNALDPLNGDLNKVTEAAGESGTAFEMLVQQLEEATNKETALRVATEQLSIVVGSDGVKALRDYGDSTTNLSNELAKSFTALGAALAPVLTRINDFVAKQFETERLSSKGINDSRFAGNAEIQKILDNPESYGLGQRGANGAGLSREGRSQIADIVRNLELQKEITITKNAQSIIEEKIKDEGLAALAAAQAKNAIIRGNNDLLDESVVAAKQAENAETVRVALLAAGTDLLKRQAAIVMGSNLFLELQNAVETAKQAKADKDLRGKEAAQRKADAAARRTAREKEQEKRKEKRLQQSIFNEDLKQLQILSKINQLGKSDLEMIKIQKEEIQLIFSAKVGQVKLVVEDLSLRKEIIETLNMQASLELDGLDRAEERLQLTKDLAELSAGAGFDVSSPFERNMKFVGGKSVLDTGPASFEEGIDLAPLIEYEVQLDRILEKYPMIGEAATAAAGLVTFGVQEMIDGTKSAEQVFADFLNNIADMLMKTAQQMIAQYIAIAIAKMFAGMGSAPQASDFNLSGFGGLSAGGASGTKGFLFGANNPLKFADGGRPPVGRPSIVGERGPELFVPGASGTIIPNHAMGGVNVDTINITVENTGEQLNPAAQKQLAGQVQGIVLSTLANERRSGGML
tara:strand:- start:1190 stop:4153 length:2964 start_codon:yes stop_codon:yes gene_type:complete